MSNRLDGKKVYIVGVVTILYAVVVVGWQQNDWQQTSQIILAALTAMGFRSAMKKLE